MSKILFIGHSIEALSSLNNKCPVDLVLVENRAVSNEIVEYCKRSELNHSFFEDFNFSEYHFTFCLVCCFGRLLRQNAIAACDTVVNIHPGDIHKTRGRHPLPQAILNGDKYMGVTSHLIVDEEIDNGPVHSLLRLPIDYSQSYQSNCDRLMNSVPHVVELLVNETVEKEIQKNFVAVDITDDCYFKPLTPEKMEAISSTTDLQQWKPISQ